MSEGLITLQEPSSPTKNLRAILRTVGINQVYDEVVEIARPSDGTTVDPTQIRALTATDIVTAIGQMQVRNSADTAWINVGPNNIASEARVPVKVMDDSGNSVGQLVGQNSVDAFRKVPAQIAIAANSYSSNSFTSANSVPLVTDINGRLFVTTGGAAIPVFMGGINTSQDLTAQGQALYFNLFTNGGSALSGAFSVTGTWSGALQVTVAADFGLFFGQTDVYDVVNDRFVSTITSNGVYIVPQIAGMYQFVVNMISYTSGTAHIFANASSEVTFSGRPYYGKDAGALPNRGVMMAGSDGSSMHYLSMDTTGKTNVNIGGNFDGAGKLLVSPSTTSANYGSTGWSGAVSVGWTRSW